MTGGNTLTLNNPFTYSAVTDALQKNDNGTLAFASGVNNSSLTGLWTIAAGAMQVNGPTTQRADGQRHRLEHGGGVATDEQRKPGEDDHRPVDSQRQRHRQRRRLGERRRPRHGEQHRRYDRAGHGGGHRGRRRDDAERAGHDQWRPALTFYGDGTTNVTTGGSIGAVTSITKTSADGGAGTVTLGTVNSLFVGPVTVNHGVLVVGSSGIGSVGGAGLITVNGNGLLQVNDTTTAVTSRLGGTRGITLADGGTFQYVANGVAASTETTTGSLTASQGTDVFNVINNGAPTAR